MLIKWLLAISAIALYLLARKAKPATNRQGQALDQRFTTQTEEPVSLTVASFNIQTGKSLSGKRAIHRSAAVISEADVVGVQEVYATSWSNLVGLGECQTHALAKPGNFGFLFCATRRRWFREHRGNAILSKLPVQAWRIAMLPDKSGKSYRNMTVAEINWQGKSFHLINTHLHTREGREEQLAVVLKEFAKYPRAILLGDFNSKAEFPLLAAALKEPEICDAIAAAKLDNHPQSGTAERIDWILTKGFMVNHGKFLEKEVSDHPYYQVNLSYK